MIAMSRSIRDEHIGDLVAVGQLNTFVFFYLQLQLIDTSIARYSPAFRPT